MDLRLFYGAIFAAAAMIVIPIVVFIGYSVAGPFFEALGGESHAVFGGMSGNSAISFGPGLIFVGMTAIVPPVVVILLIFFSGNSGNRLPPRERERRRY